MLYVPGLHVLTIHTNLLTSWGPVSLLALALAVNTYHSLQQCVLCRAWHPSHSYLAGTLADMRYDIFHATIDSEPCGLATQLFYIRPRSGRKHQDNWATCTGMGLQATCTYSSRCQTSQ